MVSDTLNKLQTVLLSTLITLSSATLAEDCYPKGKIRYLYDRKTKIEEASYCTNSWRNQLLSMDCKKSDCMALQYNEDYSPKQEYTPIGNPSFKLCYQMKATPQLIEFQVDKKWFSLDRCLFSDGSFIDASLLLQRHRERWE